MEITYKKGVPTMRLVKHNKRSNFLRILNRSAKYLLWRGHGTNLVQRTQKGKKWSKMTKNSSVLLHISGTVHHMIVIYGTHV